MSVRVSVFGAGGAMGREVVRAVLESDATVLVGAHERSESPFIGQDAGALAGTEPCGVAISPESELGKAGGTGSESGTESGAGGESDAKGGGGGKVGTDVVIDFSTPDASLRCAAMCRERGAALAVGVTGFSAEQRAELAEAGNDIAVVIAPNMSAGVNAMVSLAARAAKLLRAGKLGGGFDMEVLESHHRRKRDAPSGTALQLGEALAAATGADFSSDAVYARHGGNLSRRPEEIGFAATRGGDIAGEHRVIFAGDGERLEIVHRAANRTAFARGAVRAALFAAKSPPGIYAMSDALSDSSDKK